MHLLVRVITLEKHRSRPEQFVSRRNRKPRRAGGADPRVHTSRQSTLTLPLPCAAAPECRLTGGGGGRGACVLEIRPPKQGTLRRLYVCEAAHTEAEDTLLVLPFLQLVRVKDK